MHFMALQQTMRLSRLHVLDILVLVTLYHARPLECLGEYIFVSRESTACSVFQRVVTGSDNIVITNRGPCGHKKATNPALKTNF